MILKFFLVKLYKVLRGKMMIKYIISLIAILGLFINPVFANGHKKIKVGMITTLSGGGSGLGIDVRDGFLLAVKGDKQF